MNADDRPRSGLAGLTERIGAALNRRRPPREADSTAPSAPVRIVYAPERDGDPDPGEVVWAWVPYEEDPSNGKDRPVAIIGYVGHRLAGLILTTKVHPERRDQVRVGAGSWDREQRVSYAKLDRVLALNASEVRREGAALERNRFDELVATLRRQPEWPTPRIDIV